jgi:two-component system response regulator YesN
MIKKMFYQLRFPNTKSVFFKFLSSFMILILLPIFIFGSLAYFLFSHALQEEVKKNNDLVLRHIYLNIEQKMEEIKQTLYQTSLTVDVDSNNPTKLIDVSKTLNRIKGTQDFIDDVYVYYNETDWVITEAGLFYADHFFNNIYKPKTYDREQLLLKLRDRNDFQDLGTIKFTDAYGTDRQYMVVLSSFPLYNKAIRGTIVVFIDESKFLSITNSINVSDSQSQTGFYIFNNQLQMIYESGYKKDDKLFNGQQIQKLLNDAGANSPSNMVRYNSHFVSQYHSNVMDWKYVTLSSADHIYKPVFFLQNLTIIMSLFILGLGVMLSVFLAKNLYKPIGEIVNSFHFDIPIDWKKTKKISELEFISNHIQYITERNQKLIQNEKENIPLVKDYFAKTMILGTSEELIKNGSASTAGFKYPFYSVIVTMIEMTDSMSNTFQQMKLNSKMIEAFNQILNEEEQIMCIVTNIRRNEISILANYENVDWLMVKLRSAMEEISELPEYFQCSVALGIGRPCDELMTVNRSYEEALEALNCREIDKNMQLINHKEINIGQKFVDYPIDLEQQLIGNVLSGDYFKVEKLLNDIIDRNRHATNTFILLNDLYSTLMATAYKIIQRSRKNKEDVFDEAVISIYMNKEIASFESMKDLVFGIYRYMIETLYDKKESKNDKLKEQLIQYIETNYDGDISLGRMADHFRLNAKYLSRYFKDQTGINFIQYVNQLRIERAKQLLLNEISLNINDISEKVGYLNKNTFISTFKKYEGVTPGKYREVSTR